MNNPPIVPPITKKSILPNEKNTFNELERIRYCMCSACSPFGLSSIEELEEPGQEGSRHGICISQKQDEEDADGEGECRYVDQCWEERNGEMEHEQEHEEEKELSIRKIFGFDVGDVSTTKSLFDNDKLFSQEDVDYLMGAFKDALILALAETTMKMPTHPVPFIGHYLLLHKYQCKFDKSKREDLEVLASLRQKEIEEKIKLEKQMAAIMQHPLVLNIPPGVTISKHYFFGISDPVTFKPGIKLNTELYKLRLRLNKSNIGFEYTQAKQDKISGYLTCSLEDIYELVKHAVILIKDYIMNRADEDFEGIMSAPFDGKREQDIRTCYSKLVPKKKLAEVPQAQTHEASDILISEQNSDVEEISVESHISVYECEECICEDAGETAPLEVFSRRIKLIEVECLHAKVESRMTRLLKRLEIQTQELRKDICKRLMNVFNSLYDWQQEECKDELKNSKLVYENEIKHLLTIVNISPRDHIKLFKEMKRNVFEQLEEHYKHFDENEISYNTYKREEMEKTLMSAINGTDEIMHCNFQCLCLCNDAPSITSLYSTTTEEQKIQNIKDDINTKLFFIIKELLKLEVSLETVDAIKMIVKKFVNQTACRSVEMQEKLKEERLLRDAIRNILKSPEETICTCPLFEHIAHNMATLFEIQNKKHVENKRIVNCEIEREIFKMFSTFIAGFREVYDPCQVPRVCNKL